MSLASDALAPFQRLAAAAASMEQPARAPIEAAWRTLPLIVQDLTATLAKPIKLEMTGGETEIDRAALAPLRDALGHLIRNCADHGLETPEERRKLGKPKAGLIRLTAAQEDDAVIVRLEDDGRGLDTARIRHQAISRGLVFASDAARMAPAQIHRFIFAPGFSTAETQTRHSGRGIGMDAVRASIEALGGGVALKSEPGAGTAFTLTIPLRAPQAAPAETEAAAEETLTALPVESARVA
jgi:two-component system chemotaxis sensor kinase CheA